MWWVGRSYLCDSVHLLSFYLLCSRGTGFSFVKYFSFILHYLRYLWKKPNSEFLIKATQTFTTVYESRKPRLLPPRRLSSCIFLPPNWSSNLNSSPVGGFVVQLNLTLSNHLPAAVVRCTGKYLWLPHTDALGADGKFVLLSSVTIEGSEQLIASAWSNTLNVDCNEQTLQTVYSLILCYEFIHRYEIFCRKKKKQGRYGMIPFSY